MKTLITASRITPMIELLYILLVIKLKGRADDSSIQEVSRVAKEVIPVWSAAIPNLKAICLKVLKNKDVDSALSELGTQIRALAVQGRSDTEVPTDDIETLATLANYFRTQRDVALKKLRRTASISKSSWVVQNLAPKVGSQHDTKVALIQMVKKLVGRADSALTLDEAKQVRETHPEQYKEYLDLRRSFNQTWKDALVAYIRKSGKDKVPYAKALEYLQLNGIEHLMPSGFTGLIDDMSRLYTNKGVMIEGVPNAVTFPSVIMNEHYGKPDGGDWVFLAYRTDGSPGPYFYTADFKKKQAIKKFAKVDSLSVKMEGIRKRWLGAVKKFDIEDPNCVAACVLEILYLFSARVGSVGNKAGGQSTFGVSTLLVKHAVIDPSGNIVLRYKGKDGVATTHKILKADPDARFLIKPLNHLLADKDNKERIFTYDKGSRKIPISATQVNTYFRTVGAPADTTVHKIRTYHGTRVFKQLLDAYLESGKKPKDAKTALLIFKAMAEAVGKKLNHVRRGQSGTKVTGVTALNAYIDPSAQILYWQRVGYRVPKYLEKYDSNIVQ